jgi:hypothetical protein
MALGGVRKAFVVLRWTPFLLLLQKLFRRIPFRPVDVGKLCFLQFNGRPQVRPALLRGNATVRLATPDDLPGLTRLQNKCAEFMKRFARGDHCFIAIVAGCIVGYEWFGDGDTHLETAWGLTIAIPRGFVYAYDAYIDTAYRNTGLWLRFKASLGEWMGAHGKHGVLTFVEYGNWPSWRTHLRFGFVPSDEVLAVRVFGRTFFRRRDRHDPRQSIPGTDVPGTNIPRTSTVPSSR